MTTPSSNVFTEGTTAAATPTSGKLVLYAKTDDNLYVKNSAGTEVQVTNVTPGTVTSVSGSGGTTGLTLTGGPITTTGTLTLGGTLAIANGGTGQTTANNALNALLPSQTSNSGKVLSTNGTSTSWTALSSVPAGSSTQIQYNTSGAFDASADFTWTQSTKTLQLYGTGSGSATATISTPSIAAAQAVDLSLVAGSSTGASGTIAGSVNLTAGNATGNSSGYGGNIVLSSGTGGQLSRYGSIQFDVAGSEAGRFDYNGNFIYKKGIANPGYSLVTPTTGQTVSPAATVSMLIVKPAGTLSALTITIPTATSDGQIFTATFTQAVTTLTLNSATGSISTANKPTTSFAGVGWSYIWVTADTTWYRLY